MNARPLTGPPAADSAHGLGDSVSVPGTVGENFLAGVQSGERFRLVVGAVVGHDEQAAALAVDLIQLFLGDACQPDLSLRQVIGVLDRYVGRRGREEIFASACFADCCADGTVVLANCGHPRPLLVSPDGSARIVAPRLASLPLGLWASPSCDRHLVGAGGHLVIYTNGVQGGEACGIRPSGATGHTGQVTEETTAVLVDWVDGGVAFGGPGVSRSVIVPPGLARETAPRWTDPRRADSESGCARSRTVRR